MAQILNHCARRYLSTTITKNTAQTWQTLYPPKHEGGYKLWRNLTLFVAMPACILCMINAYVGHVEHEKHYERPPFVPYEHLRIRKKRFPWGDGNKSLFHNPKVNALPEGYEDEIKK